MGETKEGYIFWSALFSYGVVFPLSLARKLSAITMASLFSFLCCIYFVLVLVMTCLFNKDLTPELGKSLESAATDYSITAAGIFQSYPLIVFSFMY